MSSSQKIMLVSGIIWCILELLKIRLLVSPRNMVIFVQKNPVLLEGLIRSLKEDDVHIKVVYGGKDPETLELLRYIYSLGLIKEKEDAKGERLSFYI